MQNQVVSFSLTPSVAALLGISQTTLNTRLNGGRRVPPGFEEQALTMLDRVEAANRAAAVRRAEVLARMGELHR